LPYTLAQSSLLFRFVSVGGAFSPACFNEGAPSTAYSLCRPSLSPHSVNGRKLPSSRLHSEATTSEPNEYELSGIMLVLSRRDENQQHLPFLRTSFSSPPLLLLGKHAHSIIPSCFESHFLTRRQDQGPCARIQKGNEMRH